MSQVEDFAADLCAGRRCEACGEPLAPPEPCETCAAKRELLRQALPRLHGDA